MKRDHDSAIWKFTLAITDLVTVEMPEGAQVLCAQMQRDELCVWARVVPSARKESRRFAVYGTGHACFVAPQRYIGTAQTMGGSLVFHVFEVLD